MRHGHRLPRRTFTGDRSRLLIGLLISTILVATGGEAAASRSSGGSEEVEKVVVLKEWRGVVERRGSERSQPASFPPFVSDSKGWTDLWRSLELGDSPPAVDFEESMILVAVVTASSGVRMHPTLDREGDLRRNAVALPMPNPKGWEYALYLIERDGVKTVEGEAVPE